uniref:Uncharacterized protein n=1 Tax=Anguilla anguilla TaxID=7936 RepID=A0A0E9UCZ8_ANGAN
MHRFPHKIKYIDFRIISVRINICLYKTSAQCRMTV